VARRVLGGLAGIALAATGAACDAVFGLDGYGPLDAGMTTDARATDGAPDGAPEAKTPEGALPQGAAVVLAEALDVSDWCAVTVGGDVECWGNNESGQLGDGTTTASASPVKVVGVPAASSVAVGISSACAVTRAGGAYCWGTNQDGELGNGSKVPRSTTAVPVTGLESGVTAISDEGSTICAIQNGGVSCWGWAKSRILGTDRASDAFVPIKVPGLESGVTSLSVGDSSGCAVKGGAVLCWGGFDGNGELGNGTLTGSYTPVSVGGLTTSHVATVSVGRNFACAVTDTGDVMCWGYGLDGELGNGQFAESPVPVKVEGLTRGVVALSAGYASVSAILEGGSVVTWGYAGDGELGDGKVSPDAGVGGASAVPVHVQGLSGPALAVTTGQAPCVAMAKGNVECWGVVAENALVPVSVTGLDHASIVTTGGYRSIDPFACAVSSGRVSCWGGNGDGQLGDGTRTSSSIPVLNTTVGSSTVVSGATGGDFTCALASGIAYCWGDNSAGQLGNGTTKSESTSVAVPGLSQVVSISAGALSACAVTTSADGGAGGALYCWGDNSYGQLGRGSTVPSHVPVAVTGLGAGVLSVSVGTLFACALLSDGTVDCWGANDSGQVGDGTMVTRLVPTKVKGLSGATAVSAGWYAACAVTDGAIHCWGDNSFGELGTNNGISSSVPVPVIDLTKGATHVSISAGSACAVVSGGAWCWGTGPLGNDAIPYTFFYPTMVKGLSTGVTSIATGTGEACATVAKGVRCWGYNTAGQLGNGGALDAFSPVAIPGFP
jgi:alpha-tubulin suppressor-like RCC1 family protein